MQNLAFILIGLGIIALVGWAAQGFFTDNSIPLIIRIAVGAVGLGVLLLIGVAIRDRVIRAKTENFKEVDR